METQPEGTERTNTPVRPEPLSLLLRDHIPRNPGSEETGSLFYGLQSGKLRPNQARRGWLSPEDGGEGALLPASADRVGPGSSGRGIPRSNETRFRRPPPRGPATPRAKLRVLKGSERSLPPRPWAALGASGLSRKGLSFDD